ncbi:M24 family metallopeptidase [Curvivirga aplysinae]|uniref:M24 family metallopeptidase n=1 Tax=Curvivirga aplysinae TaxID=2529852 RepID=UPI0012BD1F7D|nr:Xaa-Pro peptidase family protein [Curvivirga aplysinae]MTI08359.1 aminopeptidase P family protein [Curvivirga aplysinae]
MSGIGIGGSTIEAELASAQNMREDAKAISLEEYQARIQKAKDIMLTKNIDALYLDSTTSLTYFTGIKSHQSERLLGAIIPANGDLYYICPQFESETVKEKMKLEGDLVGWEEHESPYEILIQSLKDRNIKSGTVAIDEKTQFFVVDGLQKVANDFSFINGNVVTSACRVIKSKSEITLLQQAKNLTLEVHKAAARILHKGITTIEVKKFIDDMHRAMGADNGSTFCIVLFGEPTAYPHGVSYPQSLKEGDMVLIDTGCSIDGYQSDITRTYCFGTPTEKQIEIWNLEKKAQKAAFDAAQIGTACGDVDKAARDVIAAAGLGPDYQVPGLPHRTGHGIGMDVHEDTYLVRGNKTPLAAGMCFSNEPMICIYGEFGVRLEDHFYMTDEGPKWFTEPSHSITDPFGIDA